MPQFQTEVFMYVVAPLIYFEGRATRINFVGSRLRQMIETAVLLVIAATILAGFSVTMLGVPIAFAFLMGALSTPTDATAAESVSEWHTDSRWIIIGIVLYLANLAVRFGYGVLTKMGVRGSLIFALGRVHGAVTLALVYMIADQVSDSQFDMVVLAEMMMVFLSMLVPSILFQLILPYDISLKKRRLEIQRLRTEIAKEGLAAVQDIYLPENVKQSVVYDLRDQKNANSFKDFWRQWAKASRHPKFNEQERELEVRALIWAFRAERQYLDMISQKENASKYLYELYNDILLSESILINNNDD